MVDMDGYSTVNTEEDGTYLTVFPPKGKGKRVELAKVREEIAKLNIAEVNMQAVERAVKEARRKEG